MARPQRTPTRVPAHFLLASVFLLFSIASAGRAAGEQGSDRTEGREITLELIMSDPDWLGREPENAYWGDLGEVIYFSRKRPGDPIDDLFRLPVDSNEANRSEQAGGDVVRVEPATAGQESVPGGRWHYDSETGRYDQKLYIREGDLYHVDLSTGQRTQLTRTTETESQPVFLVDGSLGFRRGDRFLSRDIDSGLESELFPLMLEEQPEEKRLEEDKNESFLARQQEDLFEIVRERRRRQDALDEERKRAQLEDPSLPGPPFYLGEDVELGTAALSPSGRHLALVLLPKERVEPEASAMSEWVTRSGNVETREVRPKVGSGEPYQARLVVLDRTTHELIETDFSTLPGIEVDPLEDLRRAAEQLSRERKVALDEAAGHHDDASDEDSSQAERDTEKNEHKLREIDIRSLSFNDDGSALVYQAFSFDNKDRWLAAVDLHSGRSMPLHHLHDPAWINWSFNDFGWSRDGASLWLLSEESGYSHLYTVELPAVSEGEPASAPDDESSTSTRSPHPLPSHALTTGSFVVSEPQLSPDGEYLYFRANRENPGRFEIYRTPFEGGWIERLTDLGGSSSAVLSPDGVNLLITHSTPTRPPELYLQRAEKGAPANQRTSTMSQAFERRSWVAPRFVEVPSSVVARPIHSRLYLPETATVEGARPAVMFVHGAGYLQNAHQGWSSYFREFMFHSFLVERGFVVLDMDYRGSAGYGRDWRTAIYRQMGTPELEDLRDGVDWLVANHGIDRRRIGVYGGSYGGFLTLMALFKEPDLFAAGAALRPVTDWAHYNHPYTSNILNTPEIDPEAYARSSPIEFASGLDRPLLICSPMLDDNVFFQDSVRLVQRLIELEKQNWWIALYPVEPHGFREPSSWLDEYRRIWQLFERYLEAEA